MGRLDFAPHSDRRACPALLYPEQWRGPCGGEVRDRALLLRRAMQVDGGRGDGGVPQVVADGLEVRAVPQEPGGVGVAQGVRQEVVLPTHVAGQNECQEARSASSASTARRRFSAGRGSSMRRRRINSGSPLSTVSVGVTGA